MGANRSPTSHPKARAAQVLGSSKQVRSLNVTVSPRARGYVPGCGLQAPFTSEPMWVAVGKDAAVMGNDNLMTSRVRMAVLFDVHLIQRLVPLFGEAAPDEHRRLNQVSPSAARERASA